MSETKDNTSQEEREAEYKQNVAHAVVDLRRSLAVCALEARFRKLPAGEFNPDVVGALVADCATEYVLDSEMAYEVVMDAVMRYNNRGDIMEQADDLLSSDKLVGGGKMQ